jgi:hypothetical protein
MFVELTPLQPARHRALRLRRHAGFEFARRTRMVAVMVAEMVPCAGTYPIVFVEDQSGDGFRPVALMGLAEGENQFVQPDGNWRASYVPAVVRAYPFALGRVPEPGEFAVCIDAGSDLISLTEGASLFEADGTATAALRQVKGWLEEMRAMQLRTDACCRALAARNLFTPLTVHVRRAHGRLQVDGCFVINEERLDGLSDASLCELRREGWLGALYAHLVSLQQFERLESGHPGASPAGGSVGVPA